MVQTSCRTKIEQGQHQSLDRSVKSRRMVDASGRRILTLDIQVHAFGMWVDPCSIHYRATSPWSASSYNLHFYTGGAFHALNIKQKEWGKSHFAPHGWCKKIAWWKPHKNLPSIAYFISCANMFHMTSALILPTFSSWGNLWEEMHFNPAPVNIYIHTHTHKYL